jgi:hypothetical protein
MGRKRRILRLKVEAVVALVCALVAVVYAVRLGPDLLTAFSGGAIAVWGLMRIPEIWRLMHPAPVPVIPDPRQPGHEEPEPADPEDVEREALTVNTCTGDHTWGRCDRDDCDFVGGAP